MTVCYVPKAEVEEPTLRVKYNNTLMGYGNHYLKT